MAKPRIIIADTDTNYIIPLQFKFIKEFFEKIELEIITDKEYFQNFFRNPQKAEVLIISDELYHSDLEKHDIHNVFIMMEEYEEGDTEELNIIRLSKYTSVGEIFNSIVGKSAEVLNVNTNKKQETQIVLVTSANGGAGKTTVAMGISACLAKNYKKVLYVNASRLQSFQYMFENKANISSNEVYIKLASGGKFVYSEIKHLIRNEVFSYIPAFKAALMSVGLEYSIFEKIILSAKESKEYEVIVVDAESTFDENKIKLLDISDKAIIVTGQDIASVEATNVFVDNINSVNTDKYIFVCNNFNKDGDNALILPNVNKKFSVNDYVEHINTHKKSKIDVLSNNNGIQKIAFLIL